VRQFVSVRLRENRASSFLSADHQACPHFIASVAGPSLKFCYYLKSFYTSEAQTELGCDARNIAELACHHHILIVSEE
jgi:hypothetical protein